MAAEPSLRFTDEQKLARHLVHMTRDRPRTLIGIAGIPGSGKSTLARHLRDALGHIAQQPDLAVVVPLDGFHLPNEELARRGLLDRKGSPETFRAQTFFAKLMEIKRGMLPVMMPLYSRQLHEPVPDALEVPPDAAVVIVEGNYLFCDFGIWRPIAALFDVKIFVETPPQRARQWIIARHIEGGAFPEDAEQKYERNDKPNSDAILSSTIGADIIFENK
jgi:pantothenate kinase